MDKKLNSHQVKFLKDAIAANPHTSKTSMQEYADELGLSLQTVQLWFKRERLNVRRKVTQRGLSLG